MAQTPSPNSGPRRGGAQPELIVLHYTAMESAEAAIARLSDPGAEVSAHYVICKSGAVSQLVAEEMRAWHAGAGEWQGRGDVNSRSIGIELDNRGDHPFSEPQMRSLEDLMRGIMGRWNIPAAGVIGHSCMAPGRKQDPGPRFDWARLARLGLARNAEKRVKPGDEAAFVAAARAAGFTGEVDAETLLAVVRLRFAPWRKGPLRDEDFAL
ncbi:MAG: N-acetylmuramoyl-L-alanine amidase [Pseudomonadota bacterium]